MHSPGYECTAHIYVIPHIGMHGNMKFSVHHPTEACFAGQLVTVLVVVLVLVLVVVLVAVLVVNSIVVVFVDLGQRAQGHFSF